MPNLTKRKPHIGITIGDPSGIGPEVVVKALNNPRIRRLGHYTVIGDETVLRRQGLHPTGNCQVLSCRCASADAIIAGRPNRASAQASLAYLNTAVELLRRKDIDGLVTAPVSKEAISSLGREFQGHTEFLARAFHVKRYEMLFVSTSLRVVVATRHIPITALSRTITAAKVFDAIDLTHAALKKFFRIPRPRLAVCGLNPHAGEGGHIGTEEGTKIIPAIAKAQKRGIRVQGPFPADTLFSPTTAQRYDAVIAMYHDQGLIPIKTLYFNELVNMTVGLPFVRTSPAHGTAFNIAGKDQANPSSMQASIRLAATLAR